MKEEREDGREGIDFHGVGENLTTRESALSTKYTDIFQIDLRIFIYIPELFSLCSSVLSHPHTLASLLVFST
jgi:hypothetical protein